MTIDELAAQVAELSDSVAVLTERVAANGEVAQQVRELLAVLRDQKPPTVSMPPMPPAPTPKVTVQGTTVNLPSAEGLEVVHEWGMEMGHFVPLRSVVKRKA